MTAPIDPLGLSDTEQAAGDPVLAGMPHDDATQPAPTDPSGHDGGFWLTSDEKEAYRAVMAWWKRLAPMARKQSAKERQRELTRVGVRGVRVVADETLDQFSIRAPLGSETSARAPNKGDQLIRRIAATLTVDPPKAEVSPNSDTSDERSDAELAQRILAVEGGFADRDDVGLLRFAIDAGGTYGSIFVLTEIDPQGDGLVALEIQAHPQATTAADALVDPATVQRGPDGQPVPGSGTPAAKEMLTTRYVTLNGQLSASAADAQMVWQPRVIESRLRPSQIRLLPTVGITDSSDAAGAMVARVRTLSQVISQCYDGQRPAEEVVKKLTSWKPDDSSDWKRWVPAAMRDQLDAAVPVREDGTITDDALVPTITLYLKSGPMAPHGVMIECGGGETVCRRIPWRVTIGDGDSQRVEHLPVPLAQFRWREDTTGGDIMGIAGIDDLAPMEEVRAAALRYTLDYMWRFGTPQTYLPFGTTVQPQQLQSRDGSPIFVDPSSRPFFEELPPLSPVVPQVYETMGHEMDTASGLEATAQGVAGDGVNSGVHAQQIIEQALVALAGIQQNANKFMCRVWSLRITFQRAYYSAPRLMGYLGEGGDYATRTWTGADLMRAGDITIQRGSGTMLPQSAKAQMAQQELQMAAQMGDTMAVTRYQHQVSGNTSSVLGLQDDPHRNRIERQLSTWRIAAKQTYPPVQPPQVVGVGPDGTPQMSNAPDPAGEQAGQIFTPNQTDELPTVAPVRFTALADTMATKAYLTADPRFQQALAAEYERMRQAAGIVTRAEQQAAQQQQQQAAQQQQAVQAQQQAAIAQNTEIVKSQEGQARDAAKVAYAEKQGGPAGQRMAEQAAIQSQFPHSDGAMQRSQPQNGPMI